MPNNYLINRLECLLDISRSIHQAGNKLSSATIGIEREFFIENILKMVIAPPFRLGTGDITDSTGKRSGQMDLVVEYGNSISFPMISSEAPRLYLAEGVCAVIEIKSNLPNQWSQVVESYNNVVKLKKNESHKIIIGGIPQKNIPYIVVGYEGWKTDNTLKEKIVELGIDGILVLDSGLYQSKESYHGQGAAALFAFLAHLQQCLGSIINATTNFESYFK